MKRYKFQALVTLAPPQDPGPIVMQEPGKLRRVVVRGQNHDTGGSRFFNALVSKNSETPRWPENDQMIVTVVLVGDDPHGYFDVGARFALWRGSELGSGVVTRRLLV